ncbi:MAG: transporter substrate-binding domain-containing protein, partial [Myxococcota bacterium]
MLVPPALLSLAFIAATPASPLDLDEYEWRLTRHTRFRYAADLDAIKRRGVLRVLTRNNSVSYYISRGKERGFEFELASAFAEALGVRVAFVVPQRRGRLMSALFDGEGDLIAAGMSVTPARSEKLVFTKPYISTQRVVATRQGLGKRISSLEDLLDVEIHLSFRSTTMQDARGVEAELGRKLQLQDVTDGAEMELMMERVVKGDYEATIVDDVLLGLEQVAGLPLEGTVAIGEQRSKAWAVHPAAPNQPCLST